MSIILDNSIFNPNHSNSVSLLTICHLNFSIFYTKLSIPPSFKSRQYHSLHDWATRDQHWQCFLGGINAFVLPPLSLTLTLAKSSCLWSHVSGRGQITLSSQCITLPRDAAWAAGWKHAEVGISCLAGSTCKPSPFVVGKKRHAWGEWMGTRWEYVWMWNVNK